MCWKVQICSALATISLGVVGDARVYVLLVDVVCQIPNTWGEKLTLRTQSAYIGLVTRWLIDISMIHCQFSALASSGSADVLGGLNWLQTFRYLYEPVVRLGSVTCVLLVVHLRYRALGERNQLCTQRVHRRLVRFPNCHKCHIRSSGWGT